MKRLQLAAASCLLAAVLPASHPGADEAPVRGFDRSAYEYSFAVAERAYEPQGWLRDARDCATSATTRWEREAVALYSDPESLKAARLELVEWTEADVALRFSAWLRDRFFGREAARLRDIVVAGTTAANARYLYSSNPDGSIQYDEAGNPRYVGQADGASLADDRAAWTAISREHLGNALASFGSGLAAMRPELLSYVPERLRMFYQDAYDEAAAAAGQKAGVELDAIVAREERLFVARKTSDVWSLRNASESEAANAIASTIVRETDAACETGMASLDARIVSATAGTGDLALAGADWLESFRQQFELGLSAWRGAEERFMVRRLEWERDAARAFGAGQEAWALAYIHLEEERRAWEAKSAVLLQNGERAFARASETLEADISRAKAEFEREAAGRSAAITERAKAWVDIYLQSGKAAASAKEGGSYWLSLLGNDVPPFGSDSLEAWLAQERGRPGASAERSRNIELAGDCLDMYRDYDAKASEAREQLLADFDLAVGSGSGNLLAVLEEGASSEDFNLDAYQVELLRAKAVQGYWRKRAAISRDVLKYATDCSSGRATAGDSIRRLGDAANAYDAALELYRTAQDALEIAGVALGGQSDAMDAAKAALCASGERLEEADEEYSVLMAALVTGGDAGFIKDELYARYRELIVESGSSAVDGAPREAELLATLYGKARELEAAESLERSGEALRRAVNGFGGESSLSSLVQLAEAIIVAPDASADFLDVGAYGIDQSDPACAMIAALLEEMRARMNGGSDHDEEVSSAYRALTVMAAKGAQARARSALGARLDGLALLGSGTADQWYAERYGNDGVQAGVGEMLETRLATSRRALFEARARLELEALQLILGSLPTDDATAHALSLASFLPWLEIFSDGASAEAEADSLQSIVDVIDAFRSEDDDEEFAALGALGGNDPAVARFIAGQGFFNVAGCDVATLHLGDLVEDVEMARGSYLAFLQYGPSSAAFDKERRSAALSVLESALSSMGLKAGFDLPNCEDAIASLFAPGVDTGVVIAAISIAADDAAANSPPWMARELEKWKESMLVWAAARSLSDGGTAPASSDVYLGRLEADRERSENLAAILSGLDGDQLYQGILDPASMESESLLDEIRTDAALLSYSLVYEKVAREAADAAAAGRKHWREYLLCDAIRDTIAGSSAEGGLPLALPAGDPEGPVGDVPRAASNWAEGTLADAFEDVSRASAALEAAFMSWTPSEPSLLLAESVKKYIDAPLTPFDPGDATQVPAGLASVYMDALNDYSEPGYRRIEARTAVARLGAAYTIAADTAALKAKLAELHGTIEIGRLDRDGAIDAYRKAGDAFEAAGIAYDASYTKAKSLFTKLEEARTVYETEDAIRRWADTAYLASSGDDDSATDGSSYRSPAAELAYSESALSRADAALAALVRLYDDGLESRPYDDPEYEAAYEEYRQNYRRLMLVQKAGKALAGAYEKEYEANVKAYDACQDAYGRVETGTLDEAFKPFLGIDEAGRLRLAYGADYSFAGTAEPSAIESYFSVESDATPAERHSSTAFRRNLDGLSAWMSTKDFSEAMVRQWGLARDCVIERLAAGNADFASIIDEAQPVLSDELLGGHRFVLLGNTLSEILSDYRSTGLRTEQVNALDSMDAEERAWFDTYMALVLCGAIVEPVAGDGSGNETYDAFSYWSRRAEYQKLESEAVREREICETGIKASAASYAGCIAAAAVAAALFFSAWLVPGFLAAAGVAYAAIIGFSLTMNGIDATRSVYRAEMADVARQTSANVPLVTEAMAESLRARKEYLASCARLEIVEGTAAGGSNLEKPSIRSALAMTGQLDEDEIAEILDLYSGFAAEANGSPANAHDALAELAGRLGSSLLDSLGLVESIYSKGEAARLEAEARYRVLYEGYISGQTGTAELEAAAISAFGPTSASRIKHVSRLAAVLEENGAMQSYAAIIERATIARMRAEQSAREAEWEVLRRELYDRTNAWREAGALILARGRADFDSGFGMIRERAVAWNKRFSDEYGTRQAAWDFSYSGSLDDKLSWTVRATKAANEASTGAILALVGTDAQSAARRLDTVRVTAITLADGASAAYDDALSKAGILGMSAAFGTQIASTYALPTAVRSGMAGVASWDSGRVLAAAADFSERSSKKLAGIQSRIMGAQVRRAADAAVAELGATIRSANENFSSSMNDLFVAEGRWQKEGGRYVKDIVVHSTVARPYITERASVASYAYFALSAWSLQTDLSDGTLAGLDPGGIQAMIARAQHEVSRKSDEVFGTAQENAAGAIVPEDRVRTFYRMKKTPKTMTRTVTRHDRDGDGYETRETYTVFVDELDKDNPVVKTVSPGTFGRHIGFDPTIDDDADTSGGQASLFLDPGSGELGRMMATYIYWSMKEGEGWSEANKAFYEKDMWDDRGSWFKAPSIRGIADIGVTIAAGAISGGAALPALLGAAAVNLTDDAVFGGLDIAGGYRSWEEAGLEFGKSLSSSAVSVMGAGLFNGYGGNAKGFFSNGLSAGLNGTSGMDELVGRTVLSGLRTTTTSLASGAIDSFSWDGTGLIWSGQAFDSRLHGGLVSASADFAAGIVSGALDLQLEGYTGDLYSGGKALSALTGGLAGQAVNYALAGRASFNLANFSMFGLEARNGGIVSGGLLELGLGKDGLSMALASGGMDSSIGALSRASGGLGAWAANARLILSSQSEAGDYASAMRSLYSFGGKAGKERELFDRILSGQTDIAFDAEGKFSAVTTRDEASGRNTIVLGRDALSDGSRFGTNIVLAHEAYRNGIDDGRAGQGNETEQAVLAHILAEESIATTYGASSLSDAMRSELRALQAARAGDASSLANVFSGYESSGDYWKLTKEGRLVNDGRARLLVEIVNDDGTPGWRLVEGSERETSVAASLVHYLGESRAMDLLGSSLYSVSNYDDQTLHDVLNLDAVDIKVMRANPDEAQRVISSAAPGQIERLLGEALMKEAGIAWLQDKSIWSGTGNGIALGSGAIHGSSAIRSTGTNSYERYSITSDIERYEGAYDVWMNGVRGDVGDGNTRLTFTKWDIDSGEQVATILAGGAWNSVDNSNGQTDSKGNPIGADQQYKIAFGPTIQGNTIAEGPLNLRWAQNGSKPEWGDVLILSDTRTIAGDRILVDGRRLGHAGEERWLLHTTERGSSDGCIVYKRLGDVSNQYQALMMSLKSWGIYQGYSISGMIIDHDVFAYKPGYKKGTW